MYLRYWMIWILLFPGLTAWGQICSGNLGENIFDQGDFGSGSANILLPDPQIAPGYQYQPNPPPNDGYYCISNNTTSWGSFAFTYWVNTGDNSADPKGYMMVVNASYTPGKFYEQQVDGLCENTLYVFSADVINLMKPGSDAIKPTVSFLLDDQVKYTTGAIAEDGKWNTYGFTFTTGPGQSSLTLTLRNNAPGGIGNDLALDNIAFRACGDEAFILPETVANICEDGEPIELTATVVGELYDTPNFQWQRSFDGGLSWYDIPGETDLSYLHTELAGGFYHYRFLLANGPANLLNPKCRVVSNVKIVHVIPKFYTLTDTLCEGLSFPLGDHLIDSPGTYTDSLLTSIGCDSIVTLHLAIIPDEKIEAGFTVIDPSCDYRSDGSVRLDSVTPYSPPVEIRIDGILSLSGQVRNRPEGDVHFLLTDRYGCVMDTFVVLTDPPPFFLSLGPDLDIELGDWVALDPFVSEPVSRFTWSLPDGVECNGCERPEWLPVRSLSVMLTAISEAGNCYATDTLNIVVRDERKIFLANIFTPNNDGINDFFVIHGLEPNVQSIEILSIFDRWGNRVFENHQFPPGDRLSGWDGTHRGVPAEPGVYTWTARVRFLDQEVIDYAGDVTLIR